VVFYQLAGLIACGLFLQKRAYGRAPSHKPRNKLDHVYLLVEVEEGHSSPILTITTSKGRLHFMHRNPEVSAIPDPPFKSDSAPICPKCYKTGDIIPLFYEKGNNKNVWCKVHGMMVWEDVYKLYND